MVRILKSVSFKEFIRVNEEIAKTSPMRCHYSSSNPLERWLWSSKKKVIRNLLSRLHIKTIIDLGCGDAGLLELIDKKVYYTGIDVSPTQVEYTKQQIKKMERYNGNVYKGDILNLEFKDNTFDAALVCDVAEHVLSVELLFKEVKRVVKKNGYILFSIPNEMLWEIARALFMKFPLRSPDHINAVFPIDIQREFPSIVEQVYLPVRFSPHLSLIHIFLVRNV